MIYHWLRPISLLPGRDLRAGSQKVSGLAEQSWPGDLIIAALTTRSSPVLAPNFFWILQAHQYTPPDAAYLQQTYSLDLTFINCTLVKV